MSEMRERCPLCNSWIARRTGPRDSMAGRWFTAMSVGGKTAKELADESDGMYKPSDIRHIIREYARRHQLRVPHDAARIRPRAVELVDRNMEMWQSWRRGTTQSELSRKYGISSQRVSQLVHRMENRYGAAELQEFIGKLDDSQKGVRNEREG